MLASLNNTASEYRRKHLQQCLDKAIDNNNEKAIEAIKNILRCEAGATFNGL